MRLSSSRNARVEARAACAYPLEVLEILVNGKVVAASGPSGEDRRSIEFNGRVGIERSSWISARTRGVVSAETFGGRQDWPLIGHAGVIFAQVGARPIRIRSDVQFLLDYTERFQEFVRLNGNFNSNEHRRIFLSNVLDAIAIYRGRLSAGVSPVRSNPMAVGLIDLRAQ